MRGGVVLVLLLGAGDSFVVPPPSCRALSQLGAEGADGPAPKVPRIRKRVRKAAMTWVERSRTGTPLNPPASFVQRKGTP